VTLGSLFEEAIRLASQGGANLGVILLLCILGAAVILLGREFNGWHPKIGGPDQPPYRPVEEENLPGTPVPQADPENPGGDCK
jgi:hypothetical protein